PSLRLGMSTTSGTCNLRKKDLTAVEEATRAQAEAAGLGDDETDYRVRMARQHAQDYNDLFDALSTRAEAGSVRQSGPEANPKEELRISLQMPERYNGTTDFGSWLRRYENTANTAGWTSATKAARL
ncbi:hypothetical protein FOL47_005994, partial [Perkinsus chesapeaki]